MSPNTSATQPSSDEWAADRQAARFRLCDYAFKTMDAEMSPAGREVGFRYLADRDGGHA